MKFLESCNLTTFELQKKINLELKSGWELLNVLCKVGWESTNNDVIAVLVRTV